MITGKQKVKCPFCGKEGVSAFVKPSYLEHSKSSISGKSSIKYFRVPESIQYQGNCPNCGKPAKEMQKATDTGVTKQLSHEERIKRMKEAGLPTRIED